MTYRLKLTLFSPPIFQCNPMLENASGADVVQGHKVKTLWGGHKIGKKISQNQLLLLSSVKTSGRFFQNFVAFSEKLDFECTGKSLSEALLHQLTHNMTTGCSLNYKFNAGKFKAQT